MAGVDVSKEKAAQIFGVDPRTIDKWLRAGMPGKKSEKGRWILNSAEISEWIKQRERESVLGDLVNIDEQEARRRKLAAEASREELKLAIEEGAVVAIADYEAELGTVISAFRAKALNFPARMAHQVMQCETIAEAKTILDAGIRSYFLN